jgi:hypothetical protein
MILTSRRHLLNVDSERKLELTMGDCFLQVSSGTSMRSNDGAITRLMHVRILSAPVISRSRSWSELQVQCYVCYFIRSNPSPASYTMLHVFVTSIAQFPFTAKAWSRVADSRRAVFSPDWCHFHPMPSSTLCFPFWISVNSIALSVSPILFSGLCCGEPGFDDWRLFSKWADRIEWIIDAPERLSGPPEVSKLYNGCLAYQNVCSEIIRLNRPVGVLTWGFSVLTTCSRKQYYISLILLRILGYCLAHAA